MTLSHTLHKLAEFNTGGLPVTSFYLDTDRSTHSHLQSVEIAHQLVRHVRTNLLSALISDSDRRSVDRDLAQFTRLVGAEPLDENVRGLAVFASSDAKLWEVIRLPVAVKNQVKVGRHSLLRPLVRLADDLAPYAVVLADREKARLFVVELGGITEFEQVVDDVPGRVHTGSYYGLNDKRIERHVDEHIHHHLIRVVNELSALTEWHNISRIVIGGTPDVVPHLQSLLTPSLLDRLAGVMTGLTIIAGRDDVLKRSMETAFQAECRKEAAVADQISDLNCRGGLGILGVTTTLQAIYRKAVRLLAVGSDLSIGGWRCLDCRRLYTATGSCPECGGDAEWLDDMVDEAIRQCLCQGANVEILSDHRPAKKLQGMGALLHFPLVRVESPILAA